jgi:hypothetical protein
MYRRSSPKWAAARPASGDGARDRETVALVSALLDEEPVREEEGGEGRWARAPMGRGLTLLLPPPFLPQVDLAKLRKVAVVRGLGSHPLRARAWPLLLGARSDPDDLTALASLAAAGHADAGVVDCDVERSLWAFTKGERVGRGGGETG